MAERSAHLAYTYLEAEEEVGKLHRALRALAKDLNRVGTSYENVNHAASVIPGEMARLLELAFAAASACEAARMHAFVEGSGEQGLRDCGQPEKR